MPTRWLEMVRHTLKSLGPKVLATRQVRDYVRELYAPAAHTSRALNSDYAGARELAQWKQHVRGAWGSVRVEHVESEGVGDAAEVGATLAVRAYVALGDLTADDVEVQVVHGRPGADDDLLDQVTTSMHVAESYEGNRHRFDADVPLDRSGPVRLHRARRAAQRRARLGRRAGPGLRAGLSHLPYGASSRRAVRVRKHGQARTRRLEQGGGMTTAADTFASFLTLLAETLELDGDERAARMHLSRFHLDRIVSATGGEPPGRMRRRLLLERAAYQLAVSDRLGRWTWRSRRASTRTRASPARSGASTARPRPAGVGTRPGRSCLRPAGCTSTRPARCGCRRPRR